MRTWIVAIHPQLTVDAGVGECEAFAEQERLCAEEWLEGSHEAGIRRFEELVRGWEACASGRSQAWREIGEVGLVGGHAEQVGQTAHLTGWKEASERGCEGTEQRSHLPRKAHACVVVTRRSDPAHVVCEVESELVEGLVDEPQREAQRGVLPGQERSASPGRPCVQPDADGGGVVHILTRWTKQEGHEGELVERILGRPGEGQIPSDELRAAPCKAQHLAEPSLRWEPAVRCPCEAKHRFDLQRERRERRAPKNPGSLARLRRGAQTGSAVAAMSHCPSRPAARCVPIPRTRGSFTISRKTRRDGYSTSATASKGVSLVPITNESTRPIHRKRPPRSSTSRRMGSA